MKKIFVTGNLKIFTLLILIPGLFIIFGCSKKSPVQPDVPAGYNENNDVAESVASTIGEETGGLTDQIADLFSMAEQTQLYKSSNTEFLDKKEAHYDSITGTWTIILSRERGNPQASHYALIGRTYTVQFINENGNPQKYWIVESDTASTINFNIIKGEGRHKTLRLSQELKNLEGSFIATGANSGIITINGTYKRAAVDTITTERFTRIHDHNIELTFTDLKGPRGSKRDLSQKISGTITGKQYGKVTFFNDDIYKERTINRDIKIIIKDGNANININKEIYSSNLTTGELNE